MSELIEIEPKQLSDVRMCVPKWPISQLSTTAHPGELAHHKLAVSQQKIWRGTPQLIVRFLGGDRTLQEQVLEYANTWQPFTGIPFVLWRGGGHHLLVDFKLGGAQAGHWSLLGTDARLSPYPDRQTLNLQFSSRQAQVQPKELRRVTLHEFGHALGAIHEHQSPTRNIPWIRERVYAWYAKYTDLRDRRVIDQQVLNASGEYSIKATPWDPHSIMEYPIDPYLVDPSFREQALETQANNDLSQQDKQFMASLYGIALPVDAASPPLPTSPTPTIPSPLTLRGELKVNGPTIPGRIDSPGQKDRYLIKVEVAGKYIISSQGATRLRAELFGPDDPAQYRVAARDADSPDLFNIRISTQLAIGQYWLLVQHENPRGRGNYWLQVRGRDI